MTDLVEQRARAGLAQIAKAAGLVMALYVASRGFGLVRELVIGYRFGTSGELDAYLAAFRLPNILFELVAGGALASAFVPTFAAHLARDDDKGAWRLASAVINLVILLTTILAIVAAAAAPWLVRTVLAPAFDQERQALAASLMRLMLTTPVIFGVSGVVMGILNARQHFLLPALAPILYNLGIIAGALFLAPARGVHGLAIGVVVGAACHLLVQVPGLHSHRFRYVPTFGLRLAGVHEVGRLMAPRVLGLAAVQINFLVNTILASGLVAGSLAALNYGWLLMLLPQGIFAQSVATAAFPTFSTQAAKGQRAEMRSALAATLRAVLYLAVPAAVGLIVLSRPVVQLVFERGAFTEASTTMVSGALTLYALALPAHSVVELVVRAFYALHDTKTPVMVSVGAMGLNVVLSILLIRVFDDLGWMPLGGLALGNSLATTAEMVVLLVLVRRRLRGLEGRQAIDSLVRIGFASALMGVASGVLAWLLAAQGIWLSAGIAMIAGLVVYVGVTLLLRTREPRTLWHLLTHRGGAALGAPR